jgi:hypothetical protein
MLSYACLESESVLLLESGLCLHLLMRRGREENILNVRVTLEGILSPLLAVNRKWICGLEFCDCVITEL